MSWRLAELFVEIRADNTKVLSALRTTRAAAVSVDRAMQRMAVHARRALLIGGAAAAGAVREYMKFEKQLAMVETMLVGQSRKHMPEYATALNKMSTQFGESTAALSKGLYDLLSASVAPEKAIQALEVATESAKGGFTNTAVAVDGLTNLLNAYGLEANKVGQISDLMFTTVRRGKLTFGELSAVIGRIAPMSRAAGMSMETMLGALATMTRQGLSAQQSAIRLVAVLRQMPEAGKDFAGAMRGFQGMGLKDIMKSVPESRAAQGIAALSADIQGLEYDIAQMANSSGARLEAFAKYQKTFAFRWDQAKQGVLSASRALATSLIPALAKVVKAVKNWAEYIGSLSGGELEEFVGILKTIGKVLIGIWVAPKLIAAARMFVGLIMGMGNAMVGLGMKSKLAAMAISTGIVAAILAVIAVAAKARANLMALRLTALQMRMQGKQEAGLLAERSNAVKDAQRARTPEDRLDALKRQRAAEDAIKLHRDELDQSAQDFYDENIGDESALGWLTRKINPYNQIDEQYDMKRRASGRSGLGAGVSKARHRQRRQLNAEIARLEARGVGQGPVGIGGVAPGSATAGAAGGGSASKRAFMGLAEMWKSLASGGKADKGMKVQEDQLEALQGIRDNTGRGGAPSLQVVPG